MSSNPNPKFDLVSLITQHGLEPFLQSSHILVGLLDSTGRVELSNPAFDSLKKVVPESTTFREIVLPAAQKEFDNILLYARRMNKITQTKLELGLQVQPGLFDCMFIPLEPDHFLFFCEPVSAFEEELRIKELEAKLQSLKITIENNKIELHAVIAQADEVSHTDTLTFLPNRKFIIADLQRQVTFSERYDAPLSVSMIDLDFFKKVNDAHGHMSGDEVLKFVASELRDHIRQPDEIGRFGGEEFLVILPNSSLKAACEQATRLCQQVRSTPIISGGKVVRMTISIGIAQFHNHHENWEKLLDRADQALLQAKQNGRDQWAILEG